MPIAKFRWLAALIAAHPGGQVIGRTRLQKTVRLLQRRGFPMNYGYATYFYGPYSEGLQSDVALLDALGLIEEEECVSREGTPYYIIRAGDDAKLAEIQPFQRIVDRLSESNPVVLELAVTYDAFRELGCDHEEALQRLRRKKGPKCEEDREDQALRLLSDLQLPVG